MKIKVVRKYPKTGYCIGLLYIEGEYLCNTLEPQVRDINRNGRFDNGEFKVTGKTAIPYGTYQVKLRYSPKFKRILPALQNVPSFVGVLIHRGNYPKDTAGCILVGENKKKGMVLNSTHYEERIVSLLTEAESRNEKSYIEIV